ncbi:DUF6009 family protein [Streptomyces candidus]|uniref:Transcription factor n=1 Tax=Streptomyces candidus TaxID=67283 RepID=A0A7X0LTC5_9ACTN|nr:DUF6009 family protein [Streptomyces candidus]MBB6440205.1 hypothetical protein [Streptomyces candidus]GHH57786.1 hypothetical protein GCM10018773_65650 [Streptomyces candidus]
MALQPSDLVHEVEIVWLEEPCHDYVRQALDKQPTRKGKPRYARDGRLIGYANLSPEAQAAFGSGLFTRRTFFLLPHDRSNEPHGEYEVGAPLEAVDPATIEPGTPGRKTPRSQNSVAITPAGSTNTGM